MRARVPAGHSPEAAAAELERCAELGHRGAIIDVFAIDVGDPDWDRLWAAAERTGLPISFHLKGGTSSGLSYQMGKWQSAAFATVLPLQLDEPLATMMFCGALERHSLRDEIDDFTRIPPSELFRRQVMATFEEDALVTDLVPLPGADSCMWASDSPHTDRAVPLGAGVLSACLSSAGPGR